MTSVSFLDDIGFDGSSLLQFLFILYQLQLRLDVFRDWPVFFSLQLSKSFGQILRGRHEGPLGLEFFGGAGGCQSQLMRARSGHVPGCSRSLCSLGFLTTLIFLSLLLWLPSSHRLFLTGSSFLGTFGFNVWFFCFC